MRGAICYRMMWTRASGTPCGSSYGCLKFWLLFFFIFLSFKWVFVIATIFIRCVTQFAIIITNRHLLQCPVARVMANFLFPWKRLLEQNQWFFVFSVPKLVALWLQVRPSYPQVGDMLAQVGCKLTASRLKLEIGSKTAQVEPRCGHARQILVSLQDSITF